jgi:hypothetical protein
LTPSVTRTSRCDGPSHCLLPNQTPWPGLAVILLADAGTRAGGTLGPTDSHCYLGSKCEVALGISLGAYRLR